MARRDPATPIDIFYRRKKWSPNSQSPLTSQEGDQEGEEEQGDQQQGKAPFERRERARKGVFWEEGEGEAENPLNQRAQQADERRRRISMVGPEQKSSPRAEDSPDEPNPLSLTQAGFLISKGEKEREENGSTTDEAAKISFDRSRASSERKSGSASGASLPKLKQRSFFAFTNQAAMPESSKRGILQMKERSLKERFIQFLTVPSLRMIFTLANALILLLSVGVMIVFTILRAESVTSNLSNTLADSITQRATFYFTEILDSSLLTTYEVSRFISLNQEALNQPELLGRYLVDVIQRTPMVDQVFYGDHLGRFALAGRRVTTNSTFVSYVNGSIYDSEGHNRIQFYINEACSPLDLSCDINGPLMEASNFDPRTRPWFLAAASGQTSSWTDIVNFAVYKDGGIIGFDSFFQGNQLVLVSAVGLTLTRLSLYLDSLVLELNEIQMGFITNEIGTLIACSSLTAEDLIPCQYVSGSNFTFNSTLPEIVTASSFFNWKQIAMTSSLQYKHQRDTIWAARAFQSKGLRWIMVLEIERSSIVGKHSQPKVFLIAPLVGGGLLLLSLLITYLLTKRITVPLKRVTKKLFAVSNLEIDPAARIIETQSRIKEVNEIETATTTLIFGLRSFSKYVPQEIVKILLQTKREATLGLAEADLSIFFSDIANFTTIAESISARELVALLGEYLMEMSYIIQISGGVVDKYIGDAVMAFWNAPNFLENHELIACDAALNSQFRLAELREGWVQNGFPKIEARIGLNCGKARVGNIGSSTRFNYTCIGDNVNLASRLEGLNKMYGTSIIISGFLHDKVRKTFLTRLLDVVAVKGKSKAVRIYELIGRRSELPPQREEGCLLFKRAFELYLARDFETSMKLFEKFLENHPGDLATKRHIESCKKFLLFPPSPLWDGVSKIDEK